MPIVTAVFLCFVRRHVHVRCVNVVGKVELCQGSAADMVKPISLFVKHCRFESSFR